MQDLYGYLADRSTSSSPAPVDKKRETPQRDSPQGNSPQKRLSPLKETQPKDFEQTKKEVRKRDSVEIRSATPQKDYIEKKRETPERTSVSKRETAERTSIGKQWESTHMEEDRKRDSSERDSLDRKRESSREDSSGDVPGDRKKISPVKRKKSVRELLSRFENTSSPDPVESTRSKKPLSIAESPVKEEDDGLKRSRFNARETSKIGEEGKKSDREESPVVKRQYSSSEETPENRFHTSQYSQKESLVRNTSNSQGKLSGQGYDSEASTSKPISISQDRDSQHKLSSSTLSKSAPIVHPQTTPGPDSSRADTRRNIREASEPLVRPGSKAAKLSTSPNVMSKIKAFETGSSDEDSKAQKLKASENVSPKEVESMDESDTSERILRPSELFPSRLRRSTSTSENSKNMAEKVRQFSSKSVVLVEETTPKSAELVSSPKAEKENAKPERASVKELWKKFERRSEKGESDGGEDTPPWTAIL